MIEKWNVRVSIERPDGEIVSSNVIGRIARERLATGVGPAMGEFLRGAADIFESPGTTEHEAEVREHIARHLADEPCSTCHPRQAAHDELVAPLFDCPRCNYDTHTCPGCGEPLSHGVEVCADCEQDR